MPFLADVFTHLFDWEKDPQRNEKIKNARFEAEFDGLDTGLSAAAARITTVSNSVAAISPASGQIAFPATQNPSADANTLDDYEEGTWPPVLTFATPGDLSVVYSAQNGAYVKIGSMVFGHFHIITSTFTHTTASGEMRITGLPFAVAGSVVTGSLFWGGITKANYTQASLQALAGSFFRLAMSGSGQAVAVVGTADMPTGGTVALSGYFQYKV
jgi:hypothetical protein